MNKLAIKPRTVSDRKLLRRAALAPLFAMLAACDGGSAAGDTLGLALDEPRRCAHCGWIESKVEIPPGVLEPRADALYEYKVRMNDGSSGVFREKTSATWRVGERLIFVAGPR